MKSHANAGIIKDIDADFIRDLREKGDMESFTRLMNKYKRPVFNFCFRYCGNMDDAEDIAQDVFIKVFKNIRSFRGESLFTTWLYRLTVNTCHNYKRQQNSRKAIEMMSIIPKENPDDSTAIDIKDPSANPEQALMEKELGEIITKAVARLNNLQRTVLILKDFDGRSYEEIAGIMDMKMGTVKSVLSRGRLNVALKIKEFYRL